ncbi:dTDP-4-amino-4,6-dideoxygalactose transaminase [Helicobacter pullorum]|uniref:dTDP-4-amino-4,6-dideoxygalactose transaminase n=1 Tax=Helicobacter pullorum TaxID=35818 RepID=UPI0008169F51|nr:dTDP-4-amino-4,6-dideoxygalactose transaminase [Helicobacter pullorum]OCR03199.1 dTDP-4-amino-4,6-dideoxygalactose transaminase [Helicobacter pullorum]OCR06262.1 dTDP-4-amino-4,6-dideoxygalactose transaminase [Helicobacter pullorum]OCR10517.1 dTDP-4-amino-4,6-dideoxygalactose transaminase [Helicobacter pullorum]OCR10818.1 dTDP-4-amino-4,6-dideoxygalactose transaminase [Helicobacter pullorum]
MILFNRAYITQEEIDNVSLAMKGNHLCGNGKFNRNVQCIFKKKFNIENIYLTPSATASLEMSALLLDIQEGDEVIMPSFTFVSTANAFVLRGARIKFVDINPLTMNIDEKAIEYAITSKTKAIIPVHYAGISCDMDRILEIAHRFKIAICEDAAQGVNSFYKGRPLGSIGEFGAFSFHETKNYTSGGEGGALVVNDEKFVERAKILQEKGTNRQAFLQGMVDKYSWVDIGSSFLMTEIQAAFLEKQLEKIEIINQKRLKIWLKYFDALKDLEKKEKIELPFVPEYSKHNAHIFYLKVKNLQERIQLLNFLKDNGVCAAFHYIPLHSSKAGLKYGEFIGVDKYTTKESERLLRLPIYYDLQEYEQEKIISLIYAFWGM